MGTSTKVGAVIASVLALLTSVAVIVFLVLGLCGVFALDSDYANEYHVTFIANEQVLMDQYYLKGEKIEMNFTVPSKPDDDKATDYIFEGWDTNGDNLINIVPKKAYSTFTAVAIYRGTPRKIEPVSTVSQYDDWR